MVEVGKESIWKNGMELSYWYPDTFVSGSQNKNGMKMKAFFQDSRVVTRYTFDKQFQGGPGLVHGGILSAAVDDLMGYAAIIHKRACVTAKLEVNYILPDEETIHTETNAMFIDLGERASEVFKQSQDTENQLFEYKEETQYP